MYLLGARNTLCVTTRGIAGGFLIQARDFDDSGFLACCAEERGINKRLKRLFSRPTPRKRQVSQMIFLKTSRQALPPFSL
jgi:hypothetical protein